MRTERRRPSDWPAWFVPKGYPHFDGPIVDPKRVQGLVETPDRVASHAFLPFIRFERLTRKFDAATKSYVPKIRDLKYASHTDSQIFRHYAQVLSEHYENVLDREGLTNAVLAYRRVTPRRCNVHFALDAFRWIHTTGTCQVLAFDIKNFFENLEHQRLKRCWAEVLGVGSLPSDQYAVFRAITRYAYVDLAEAREVLGIADGAAIRRLCTPDTFRKLIAKGRHIKPNDRERDGRPVGVPQGSPISALASNLYMLPLDRRLAQVAAEMGGMYRRYSDDILIACEPGSVDVLTSELRAAVAERGLDIHDDPRKCLSIRFDRLDDGAIRSTGTLQYLGLTYDGQCVRIRPGTWARYVRRLRRAVRREEYAVRRLSTGDGGIRLRRRRLYAAFSHLDRESFIRTYAYKASRIFQTEAPELRCLIRRQTRGHWGGLHELIRDAELSKQGSANET
jgi:RNA-directed DNA polymerase